MLDTRDAVTDDVATLLEAGGSSADLLNLEAGDAAPLLNVSEQDLRNIFDADFAARVFSASNTEWVGPFVSNRGQHWLRTTNRTPERIPALEEIRDRVRLEWISEEEDARLQDAINELWNKYTVRLVEGGNEE